MGEMILTGETDVLKEKRFPAPCHKFHRDWTRLDRNNKWRLVLPRRKHAASPLQIPSSWYCSEK